MINKLIKTIAFCALTLNATGQTFEGKISYSNTYESKIANLKSEQLDMMMGTRQDYYIKSNSYKSVVNGSFLKMQLYEPLENKAYTLTGANDTLYWEDCSINKDEAIKYELQKNKEVILGITCDVLIIEGAKSKTYYYFNSKYGVDPELFKGHNYLNWYYTISKTKALPLKTVYDSEQFTLTSTATEIKEQKLEDNFFALPEKSKTAKAYW